MKEDFNKKLKFGFYKQKLSTLNILLLSFIIVIECILLYLKINKIENESVKIIGTIIFVIIWWLPIGFGFANHYRNIYFNLVWLLICIIWINIHTDWVTSILPITVYLYINFTRLLFKYIFKYEPIFMLVSKFPHYSYNKIENRESNIKDYVFSLLVFIIGAISSILISIMK